MPTPLPQHCPSPRELDDLELLLSGALSPRLTFDNLPVGRAPGGGPPVVTLELPVDLQGQTVELVDPEGLPLARLDRTGTLTPLSRPQYGAFRRLHLTPTEARATYAGRTWVAVTDALTQTQLDDLAIHGPIVLVALTGTGTPALTPEALVRATLAGARHLLEADVVVVPLPAHGDPAVDHALGAEVLGNYALHDPVHAVVEPTDADAERYPDDIAEIVERDQPGPEERGLVLFFTGLSGSGKSTLARALMDLVLEHGRRRVTSLDGDVVRRHLSAGLTFSKEDRETNIRRIGWVAAEVARHGGVAVCSPIAPFDHTRQQVREMVEAAGGDFFLVHVATPLEECERRDRKGLYAKARRGEIPEFTGISSPYEEPTDATVRVDTTGRSIEDALADVLAALDQAGYGSLVGRDELPTAPEPARPASLTTAPAPVASTTQATPADPVSPVSPASPVASTAGGATHASPAPPASPAPAPAAPEPLRVLFVCTANICRSPYMELTARALHAQHGKPGSVEFSSAGTHGFTDRVMDTQMLEVLEAGADGSTFRSRAVARDLIDRADLILTAEAKHREFLVEDHPRAFRRIFTLGQFAESMDAPSTEGLSGRELIEAVGKLRAPSKPEHDVDDPYRRGPEAARTAADHITALLRRIIPRLSETVDSDA